MFGIGYIPHKLRREVRALIARGIITDRRLKAISVKKLPRARASRCNVVNRGLYARTLIAISVPDRTALLSLTLCDLNAMLQLKIVAGVISPPRSH